MVGYGLKQDDIATAIGISDVTLRRHYAPEIATGAITANAQVAQSLFNAATRDGNMTAAIWWTKTRMGWKETMRLGGEDGQPLFPSVTVLFGRDDATGED